MSTNDDNYLELTPIILEGSSQKTNDGLSVVKLGLYMGIAFFFATLIIIIVLPRVILCIRGYFLTETKIKEKRQKKIDKWIITKVSYLAESKRFSLCKLVTLCLTE